MKYTQGLYVITHKEIDNIYGKSRKILMVGAYNKENIKKDYLRDDVGENISNKNPNYCELTGLYWIINHDTKSDVIGLEHYRRVFINNLIYINKYPMLSTKQINKLMNKYDLILPRKVYFDLSIYEHYKKDHYSSDLDKVENILKEKYPNYLESYKKVINQNGIYLFNMFIGKRKIIEDYSNWLFDILFELEKKINLIDRDNYQKRVYGFLSERLFNVYLEKHKNEIKIKEKRVEFIETTPMKTQINRIKRKLKKGCK